MSGQSVSEALNADMRDYFRWRATTTVLLSAKVTESQLNAAADVVTKKILDVVKPYVTLKNDLTLKRRLFETTCHAVELDRLFNQQRADLWSQEIKSRFHYHSFEPDPEFCDWEGQVPPPDQQFQIRLVITPALVKRGDMDGRNYEMTTTLVKARVSVEEPPEPPSKKSKSPISTSPAPTYSQANHLTKPRPPPRQQHTELASYDHEQGEPFFQDN